MADSGSGRLIGRTTRFTMLLELPRMEGHGDGPRVKNGPALAGHGAEAVRHAIAASIGTLPDQLRRSLTWDQGAEMAQHAQLRIETGLEIYFCDPHSPWQHPPKPSMSIYAPSHKPMLRPPVEPELAALVAVEDDAGDVAAAHRRGHAQRGLGQGGVVVLTDGKAGSRRLARSSTVARYNLPSSVGISV